MNGIPELPQNAVWFDSKKPVKVRIEDGNMVLSLSDQCPNPYYATIDLYFQQPPVQLVQYPLKDHQVRLTPFQAVTSEMLKKNIPYALLLGYYGMAEAEFKVYLEAGKYTIEAEYASWYHPLGGEIYFIIDDDQTVSGLYKNTGNPIIPNDVNNYILDDFGGVSIDIPFSKQYSIKIKRSVVPDITNWIWVRSFILKKILGSGIQNTQVNIYPNFVRNNYFVCESPLEQIIKIYDVRGKLRQTDTVGRYKRVNISTLEAGLYIVKGENFIQKIVIL